MYCMGETTSSNGPRNSIIFYEHYCDGQLRTADGLTFKIHKVLLGQRSEYFRALFSFEANNNTTDILIKEIGSQTLWQILHYIYEGVLHLDKRNVLELMVAADYMLLDDLMEKCRDFAIRSMTPSNCLSLSTIAWRCERLNILRECSRYVKVHFEEIVKSSPGEIGDLPIEVLKELLNDNALNYKSEETVLMAIINWIKADPFNRNIHLPDLINYIRFEEADHIPKMIEVSTVISNPFRVEPLQVAHPIIELSNDNLSRETYLPKYLHVGGHISQSETTTVIYLSYDEELDFWRKIANVLWFPEIIGPIGKYIYLFYSNFAQRYDVLEDQLTPLASMSLYRYACCVVELHGMIYALGSDEGDVSAIERYNPFTETWNLLQPVDITEICGAVAMNGKIYALGFIENNFLNDMGTRVYDPMTNIWTAVKSPSVLRTSVSVVVFQNRLYLIGGCYDNEILRSVEEYDPILDVWSSLPDLPLSCVKTFAKVQDGTITVFQDHKYPRHWSINPALPLVSWDCTRRAWQKVKSVFTIYKYGILDDPNVVKELVKRRSRSTFQWDRNVSIKIYDS